MTSKSSAALPSVVAEHIDAINTSDLSVI